MERILLGALLITLFVSCGKSPEEKANALIEDDIKKVLSVSYTHLTLPTKA